MNPRPAWQTSFGFLGCTAIVVEPSGARLSSEGGLLPIRQFDEAIGLTARFAGALEDRRKPEHVRCTLLEIVRARILGIVAGYVDQNDHDVFRSDPVMMMVAGRWPDAEPPASQPTLSRFENDVRCAELFRLRDATVDAFLDSFAEAPRRLTFDFDAVDDACHGQRRMAMFHAYYELH